MLISRQCFMTVEYICSADNPADPPSRGVFTNSVKKTTFRGFPAGSSGIINRINKCLYPLIHPILSTQASKKGYRRTKYPAEYPPRTSDEEYLTSPSGKRPNSILSAQISQIAHPSNSHSNMMGTDTTIKARIR
jgi:hypothetical protein